MAVRFITRSAHVYWVVAGGVLLGTVALHGRRWHCALPASREWSDQGPDAHTDFGTRAEAADELVAIHYHRVSA